MQSIIKAKRTLSLAALAMLLAALGISAAFGQQGKKQEAPQIVSGFASVPLFTTTDTLVQVLTVGVNGFILQTTCVGPTSFGQANGGYYFSGNTVGIFLLTAFVQVQPCQTQLSIALPPGEVISCRPFADVTLGRSFCTVSGIE